AGSDALFGARDRTRDGVPHAQAAGGRRDGPSDQPAWRRAALRGFVARAPSSFPVHPLQSRLRHSGLSRRSPAPCSARIHRRASRRDALWPLLGLRPAPAARPCMIRLEQVRFAYNGGADVLRLEEFALERQSHVLVVGPSGCGKTTLLHLIAGLLLPTHGSVRVDGQDLSALSAPARDRFRGRHVGIVLQQFHLLPTLTAMQNLLV